MIYLILIEIKTEKLVKHYPSNMKLQQMKQGQYFLTLPSQIVRAKGWKKGAYLKIEINKEDNLIIKKMKRIII